MIRFLRMTNAERIAYGGLEPGRLCLETDTDLLWIGTAGGDIQVTEEPETYWNPDAFPAAPTAQDDHFKAGSLDPKWSEYDYGTAKLTISVADTFAVLAHETEVTWALRGMYQTLPAGDFTIVCKVALIGRVFNWQKYMLALFQNAASSTSDLIVHGGVYGTGYRDAITQYYTSYTTWSSNYISGLIYPNSTEYYRIRRNGTNLYYEYSSDGVSWQMVYTHVQPWAPAHMGIITHNYDTGMTIYGYFDFFRYIASDQVGPIGELE